MLRNIMRNQQRSRSLLRKLALAAATVVVVVTANVTPAKAWYDAYGYWHPNHQHYYYDRDYYDRERAYRSSYAWRHHRWCERHPGACYERDYWRP
jgi:hypothetical protein